MLGGRFWARGCAVSGTRRPSAPKDLGTRSRKFFREVYAIYDLSMSEHQLLLEACRTLDDCDALRERIELDGHMVKGSTGQSRLHPAVPELRQARTTLAKLLDQLGLPNPESGEQPVTASQRRAAKAGQARWRQDAERAARRREGSI